MTDIALDKIDRPDAPQRAVRVPRRLAGRPRDARGFIVPRFVAWVGGEPDFRVVDTAFFAEAMRRRLCWLCGETLGRHLAFVIGPMCALTRTTSEPPCHRECAEYSVKVCPFMLRPRMRRNTVDMPAGHVAAPGMPIDRNPGVMVIWICERYSTFRARADDSRPLITVGPHTELFWYREGRAATRGEARESVESGMPILLADADAQDRAERRAPDDPLSARYALLHHYKARLEALLPAA